MKYKILYHFWRNGVKGFQEYNNCDILLCPNEEYEIYKGLKNLLNSGQEDKDEVLKNIRKINNYPSCNNSNIILLLPARRLADYVSDMWNKINKFIINNNYSVESTNKAEGQEKDSIILFRLKRQGFKVDSLYPFQNKY